MIPAGEFYVTGGTMPGAAPSYVPRGADEELFTGLSRSEFCYVLTSRQMGKSSLMVRTAQRLRQAGARVALLSLDAIGANLTPEQWYDALLTRLGRQLGLGDELESHWLATARQSPLQRWTGGLVEVVLRRLDGPVVVFVDEIDYVRSLPFPTGEFFAAIREFHNRRTDDPTLGRLTFCLLGVTTPSELIRDTRTTPFNIGRRVELHDFTPAEAAPLAAGLSRDPVAAARLLERVLYWTGGNPYLTQRLCQAVASAAPPASRTVVDRYCSNLFLAAGAQMRDDNLMFVRDRLLRGAGDREEDRAALLDLYGQVLVGATVPDDETNPVVAPLRLSGATKSTAGRLHIRNRIYARVFDRAWVRANMPDAEKRRQLRAYRKGLVRASSWAAAAMAVVSTLGWFAWGQFRHGIEVEAKLDAANSARADIESERDKAAAALLKEQAARGETDLARAAESKQRERAEAEAGKARDRAVQLAALTGIGFQDRGDLTSALPWFAEALRLVAGNPDGELLHKLRLASAVGHFPRPIWMSAEKNITHAEFGPDGKTVLVVCPAEESTELRVVDLETGATRGRVDVPGSAKGAAFGPDGLRVFMDRGARSHLWDVTTGQLSPNPWVTKVLSLSGSNRQWLITRDLQSTCLGISADGARVVTGGDDTARVWDARTGHLLRELKGRTGTISAIAATADGARVVTGSDDKTVRVWDAHTGYLLRELKGHTRIVRAVATTADGSRVVTGSDDKTVRVWDARTGHLLHKLVWDARVEQLLQELGENTRGGLLSVAVSADGSRVVMGSDDKMARVWDARTGQPLHELKGHTDWVRSVAVSADGSRVVTGSDDRTARVWDARTGQLLHELKGHTDWVRSVAVSADGARVVTGSDDQTARVWDARTGQLLREFKEHPANIHSVALSADGSRVVTGGTDNRVRVWDPTSGQALTDGIGGDHYYRFRHTSTHKPVGDLIPADCEFILPTAGKWLLVRSRNRPPMLGETIRVWNGECGCPVGSSLRMSKDMSELVTRAPIAAFSRDGQLVAIGNERGEIGIWNVPTGQVAQTISHKSSGRDRAGSDPPVDLLDDLLEDRDERTGLRSRLVTFANRNRQVVAVENSREGTSYRVFDIATGKLRQEAALQKRAVQMAASPDGRWLFACDRTGAALLIELEPANPLDVLRVTRTDLPATDVRFAEFSPDGRFLATASADGSARVWGVPSLEPLTPPLRHAEPVTRVTYSPDGRLLLTVSADKTVRVWEVSGGQRLLAPMEDLARVRSVEASRDGRRVAMASADGTVRLHDTTTGEVTVLPPRPGVWACRAWISPDGARVLVARSNGRIGVWTPAARGGEPFREFEGETGVPTTCTFSPDGRWAVTVGHRFGAANEEVWLWDTEAGTRVAETSSGAVRAVAVGPGGEAAVARGSGPVLWSSVKAPRRLGAEDLDSIVSLAFSGDGRSVACSDSEGRVQIWEVGGDRRVATFQHSKGMSKVVLDHGGRRALTFTPDEVRLWALAGTGPAISSGVGGPERNVTVAEFCLNDRCVVIAGDSAQLWDSKTGMSVTPPFRSVFPVRSVRISPEGDHLLAIGSDNRVSCWDLKTTRPSADLQRLALAASASELDEQSSRVVPLTSARLRDVWPAAGTGPAPDGGRVWQRCEFGLCETGGDWERALWYLDALAQSPLEANAVRLPRARVRTRMGRFDEAVREYAEALRVPGADPGIPWEVARVHVRRGEAEMRDAGTGRAVAGAVGTGANPWGWVGLIHDPLTESMSCFRACELALASLPNDDPRTIAVTIELLDAYSQMADLAKGHHSLAKLAGQKCRQLISVLYSRNADVLVTDWVRAHAKRDEILTLLDQIAELARSAGDQPTALRIEALVRDRIRVWRVAAESDGSLRKDLLAHLVVARETRSKQQRWDDARWLSGIRVEMCEASGAERDELHAAVLDFAKVEADAANWPGAIRLGERAIKLADEMIQADPKKDSNHMALSNTLGYVGRWQQMAGNLGAAEVVLVRARDHDQEWANRAPATWHPWQYLGVSISDLAKLRRVQGRLPEARDLYAERVRMLRSAVERVPDNSSLKRDLLSAYEDMATWVAEASEKRDAWVQLATMLEEALRDKPADLEAVKPLLGRPSDLVTAKQAAKAHMWAGDSELQLGNVTAALKHCRRSLRLREQIVEKEGDVENRRWLAFAHRWLGFALERAGDPSGAIAEHQKEVEIQSGVLGTDPRNNLYLESAANAWSNLGEALRRSGQPGAAKHPLSESVRLWQQVTRVESNRGGTPPEHQAVAVGLLGQALLDLDDVRAARAEFRTALALTDRAAETTPSRPQLRMARAVLLGRNGWAALRAGDYDEAVDWFRKQLDVMERLEQENLLVDRHDKELLRTAHRNHDLARNAKRAIKELPFALRQPTRQLTADLLRFRSAARARSGDANAAGESAEALRQLDPNSPENLFATAQCYGTIVKAILRGRTLAELPEGDKKAHDEYASKATAALLAAVGAGFSDHRRVLYAEELDTIRGLSAYRELVTTFKGPRFEPAPPPRHSLNGGG